ncbi:hypothetical protein DFH09DRAFT_1067829 [Mycena vulgaris]|nr:hypothetical protein DFH09DRAFT_1067829 [Mycena vulgaris]
MSMPAVRFCNPEVARCATRAGRFSILVSDLEVRILSFRSIEWMRVERVEFSKPKDELDDRATLRGAAGGYRSHGWDGIVVASIIRRGCRGWMIKSGNGAWDWE